MARWKLYVSTTFEILPLSTCTQCQQKSYISKGIQPIFEIFTSARRCWGWAFGRKVSGAQIYYFCNSKVKTLRIDNIWNFATFKLYTVPEKFLYLQRCSTDFRNLCFSSKMLRVGICVENFRCADMVLLQWQGENFAHLQHLKYPTCQPVHCASKNPISPKVFNRFSKSLPQLEDLEGGHLGGKFQARRYFTFAMARWKLCACTTFEISHFQPVHCACKNPISPKVFNRFSKSLPQLEAVEGGHLEGKLQERSYLSFAMARWKLCACTTFEISHFQPVDCACKNPISPKVFNRFSKSLPQLEDFEGGHLGGKIQARRYFTFAMARWKPCACTTFEISHFQPVHCPSKNPISPKVFNRFSKSLPQLEDVECGHFGVERFRRAAILLLQWQGENFAHLQHLKFPTFNLYTVPAKILYLQTYSTDFRNLCLSSKESLRVGIWVESFKCAGILLLQWQGENFASRQHLKFCHFQPVHCASKNPISPKVLNRFSKSLPQLEDVWGWAFGWKVSGAQVFYFCNGKVKTLRMYNIWNFPLSTCTLSRQKSYISKGIQPIFEIFASARRLLRVGIWVESFRRADILLLQWQGENFAHRTTFEICQFEVVHCASKNPISPKAFNRFSKSLPQLEDFEGGHLGGKFQARRYFTFAMARWNPLRM